MAKAMKETLVCRPCGTRVMVTDLGTAVVECYECGVELVPAKAAAKAVARPAARKALPKKALPKKALPKKALPKKAAPKKTAAKKPAKKAAPKKK